MRVLGHGSCTFQKAGIGWCARRPRVGSNEPHQCPLRYRPQRTTGHRYGQTEANDDEGHGRSPELTRPTLGRLRQSPPPSAASRTGTRSRRRDSYDGGAPDRSHRPNNQGGVRCVQSRWCPCIAVGERRPTLLGIRLAHGCTGGSRSRDRPGRRRYPASRDRRCPRNLCGGDGIPSRPRNVGRHRGLGCAEESGARSPAPVASPAAGGRPITRHPLAPSALDQRATATPQTGSGIRECPLWPTQSVPDC